MAWHTWIPKKISIKFKRVRIHDESSHSEISNLEFYLAMSGLYLYLLSSIELEWRRHGYLFWIFFFKKKFIKWGVIFYAMPKKSYVITAKLIPSTTAIRYHRVVCKQYNVPTRSRERMKKPFCILSVNIYVTLLIGSLSHTRQRIRDVTTSI